MLEENAYDKYKSGNVRNSKLIYIFKEVEKSGKEVSWSTFRLILKYLNMRTFNFVSLNASSLKSLFLFTFFLVKYLRVRVLRMKSCCWKCERWWWLPAGVRSLPHRRQMSSEEWHGKSILYNRLVPITFKLYGATKPHECNEPNSAVVYPEVTHR